MKILVAEDDRVTRTRILSFLKEWGHDGTGAADGEEAWQLFRQEAFEMIVTDWLMPGMDGPDLLRKIRETESGTYAYAILLTSRSEKSDVVTGMESGADDFVSKPFDKDELRVRIQAAQRIIELEQALAEQNRQLAAANDVLLSANRRMKESLDAAAKIQQSFLPEHLPKSPAAEFSWVYQPCDELGGDTLNIVRLDDDHIGIYIIDVSGHGVPAALLSVHVSRYLTRPGTLMKQLDDGEIELTDPVALMAELNRHFTFDDGSSQYFTAVYGVLDLVTREFRYSSAGHPGPLRVSAGEGQLHKATPPAVGFLPNPTFKSQSIACQAGDRLYFYTDGIFEMRNASDEEFGQERLRDALAAASGATLSDSLRMVRYAVSAWSDGAPFDDDVSLIGIELR